MMPLHTDKIRIYTQLSTGEGIEDERRNFGAERCEKRVAVKKVLTLTLYITACGHSTATLRP